MARYKKVYCRIWCDEKFRSMTNPASGSRFLCLFLLTTRLSSSLPGLFSYNRYQFAAEIGWSQRTFNKHINELRLQKFLEFSDDDGVLYIPNAIKYNKPESPNVILSWRNPLDEIPACTLKEKAILEWKAFMEGFGRGYSEAFAEVLLEALPKDLPKGFGESRAVAVAVARARARAVAGPSALKPAPEGRKSFL